MLDVHPPHAPTHTWKDFFIHIATIVIGLIIAVGLEQAVEIAHQHYELRETREALRQEFEANLPKLETDERNWLATAAELKNNLLVLEFIRTHPGVPQTALPGDLEWDQSAFLSDSTVWDAAQKNGITRRMPIEEATRSDGLYSLLNGLGQQSSATWLAINNAHHFDLLDTDPTHLSPQKLGEVIELTETALARHIEMGYSYGLMTMHFPDLPQYLTYAKIDAIRPDALALDPKGLAAAHQLTRDRIQTAQAAIPESR